MFFYMGTKISNNKGHEPHFKTIIGQCLCHVKNINVGARSADIRSSLPSISYICINFYSDRIGSDKNKTT